MKKKFLLLAAVLLPLSIAISSCGEPGGFEDGPRGGGYNQGQGGEDNTGGQDTPGGEDNPSGGGTTTASGVGIYNGWMVSYIYGCYYTYDSSNHLKHCMVNLGTDSIVCDVDYNNRTASFGDNDNLSYTFNSSGYLASITETWADGSDSFTCTYDTDGHLTRLLETYKANESGTVRQTSETYTFTYNSTGNMTQARRSVNGNEDGENYTKQYDYTFTYGNTANPYYQHTPTTLDFVLPDYFYLFAYCGWFGNGSAYFCTKATQAYQENGTRYDDYSRTMSDITTWDDGALDAYTLSIAEDYTQTINDELGYVAANATSNGNDNINGNGNGNENGNYNGNGPQGRIRQHIMRTRVKGDAIRRIHNRQGR